MIRLLALIALLTLPTAAKVVLIPIDKEIEPGLTTFLKRAIKDAETQKPEAIIFEINTFGGQVNAAFDIVEIISAIKVPTIAYVKEKAISAGCLIALANSKLIMEPNTTIGDCAPIMMGQEGPVMMGEKFQSPLRAKFRSLAQKNGYPVKLTEAFVSTDWEVIEVFYADGRKELLTGVEYGDLSDADKIKIVRKKTIVPKGRLLTLSAAEAEELGFSSGTVATPAEAAALIGIKNAEIVRLEKKRSEQFLIWFNKIAPILLLLGLFGVYMEIKTPGFGLFGIIGITAFALFFGTKYVVGLADHIEILLFGLGIALLIVEVFIMPGTGIFAAAGIGLMLASAVLAMQSFNLPKLPWEKVLFKKNLVTVGAIFAVSVPFFLVALFSASKLVLSTRLGHQTAETSVEGFTPASEDYSDLVGRQGTVKSQLRPAGIVEINGRRYDVVSDGDFVNEGADVSVTEVAGNRIVVRKV